MPSLTDESGHFYAHDRIPDLLAGARIEDVEREFRAQIGTVLTANLQPTHLDFHCVAGGGRADIFDLALGLAREFGLALRVHGRANAARCRRQGLPANDHPVLDSLPSGGGGQDCPLPGITPRPATGSHRVGGASEPGKCGSPGDRTRQAGRFAGRITIFWYHLMLALFSTRRRSRFSTTAPSRQSGSGNSVVPDP